MGEADIEALCRAARWLSNAYNTGRVRYWRTDVDRHHSSLTVCFANGDTRKEGGATLAEALGKIVPGWESEVSNLESLNVGSGI